MRVSRSILMITLISVFMLTAAPTGTSAQTAGPDTETPALAPDHSMWDEILMKYTENGLVDYAALKKDSSGLDAYLAMLTSASAEDFGEWNRDEKMAFWINAYNAVTIHGILINYPIQPGGFMARRRFPQSSIRQIKNFWKTKFIELAGKPVTLDEIEHEILRREFADPRIHFSIVCASLGCPVLSGRAYTAERLKKQLREDAMRFISDPKKVRLDRDKNFLKVSEIFKWYREDFKKWEDRDKPEMYSPPEWLKKYNKHDQGFVQFIVDYAPLETIEYIVEMSPKLIYIEYDWTLNERQGEKKEK